MIYFIQMEGTDYYKIGYTQSETPQGRMAQLQTACPRKLILIATCQGELLDEARLHAEHVDKRTNGGDEWFQLTTEEASSLTKGMEKAHDQSNQHPIDGDSAFDVRPICGRQQYSPSATRTDVSGQPTAFDNASNQHVLDAMRRKH